MGIEIIREESGIDDGHSLEIIFSAGDRVALTLQPQRENKNK